MTVQRLHRAFPAQSWRRKVHIQPRRSQPWQASRAFTKQQTSSESQSSVATSVLCRHFAALRPFTSSAPRPTTLSSSSSIRYTSRRSLTTVTGRDIKIYQPLPSLRKKCPDPIAQLTQTQLATLDPTNARTRLFARTNPEAARVGDILLVRTRTGDPFAGVCLSIRRRGVDTAILLRNQLTRVGVEMWFKVYSPSVDGIEVVQRRQRRARRARLYYMRQPKHDMGSVQGIMQQYLRSRAALRSGAGAARVGGKGKKGKK